MLAIAALKNAVAMTQTTANAAPRPAVVAPNLAVKWRLRNCYAEWVFAESRSSSI